MLTELQRCREKKEDGDKSPWLKPCWKGQRGGGGSGSENEWKVTVGVKVRVKGGGGSGSVRYEASGLGSERGVEGQG